jgi:hypothetical protein
MISHGERLGVNTHTLKGAWKTNLSVRPERDWEQLKGRAIVNNDTNQQVSLFEGTNE